MIKIFAKKNTNEKVLIMCPRENVGNVMEALNLKYGPSWLLVDELKIGEFLTFKDDLIYQGYTSKIKRYSSNIQKL